MYQRSVHRLNVCSLLRERAAKARARVEEAEKVASLKVQLTNEYNKATENLRVVMESREFTANNIKIVEQYANARKERSMAAIHASIQGACSIISNAKGISLKIQGQDAKLINKEGLDVNNLEGSAFRAILSYMIRNTVLRNTNYLQLMFYDEPLSTLNDVTSANLSTFLPVTSFGMTTVLTEQKSDVFANLEDYDTYRFEWLDGVSRVRRQTSDV